MDFASLITIILSSAGVSAGTAAWLARALVSHNLEKQMVAFKEQIQAQREASQAVIEGEIREQVETSLGERAAQREYELAARQRLYSAIGPLRFQLLLACR